MALTEKEREMLAAAKAYQKDTKGIAKSIAQAHKRALKDLQDDSARILETYTRRGGFSSRAEAEAFLAKPMTAREREILIERAKQTYSGKRLEQELVRLSGPAYTYRMTRKDAIAKSASMAAERLRNDAESKIRVGLDSTVIEAAKRTEYAAQKDAGITADMTLPNRKQIDQVQRGTGVYHKVKLWSDDELKTARTTITEGILSGRSLTSISRDLEEQSGKAPYVARRLVRTTMAQAAADEAEASIKSRGYEQYEIVCTPDERLCDICAQYDGMICPVGKGPMPVFHPNCRCTIRPVFDESVMAKLEQLHGKRKTEGTALERVKEMTYSEWQARYAKEGTDEARKAFRAENAKPMTATKQVSKAAEKPVPKPAEPTPAPARAEPKPTREAESARVTRARDAMKDHTKAVYEATHREAVAIQAEARAKVQKAQAKFDKEPTYKNEKALKSARNSLDSADWTLNEIETTYASRGDSWTPFGKDGVRVAYTPAVTRRYVQAIVDSEDAYYASKGMDAVRAELSAKGVDYRPIERNTKELDSDAIVDKIAGGDETHGSCVSQALTYIANLFGWDVRDYRGGESKEVFSRMTTNAISKWAVASTRTKDTVAGGMEVLKAVTDDGKPYILITGQHCAVVRKVNGRLEYLETQSADPKRNGWMPFERDIVRTASDGSTIRRHISAETILEQRFGCTTKYSLHPSEYEQPSELVDAELMRDDADFVEILGYLNTEEARMMRGARGHEY